MAAISRTYSFTNGSNADASQVESEVNNIVSTWNSHNTGTTSWDNVNAVASTITTLTATTVNATNLTVTNLPSGVFLPGEMKPYAGASAPTGWLICNGAAINRTTYSGLFAVIGTTYGAGDGVDTFNIPDARGKFLVGKAAAGTFANLAATGGAETHTHTITVSGDGDHAHNIDTNGTTNLGGIVGSVVINGPGLSYSNIGGGTPYGVAASNTTAATHSHTGSSSTNSGLPPFLTINYIIKS